ncbi:MAG TPA: ATP-binding protein [Actinophytocola sp.]|uniref:ATP-binding protein n=1 Tax=Actinophytocola sp. TaxID=1872138 RepID=UPI002DDD5A0B|nr:ATP-binding protein [Actinophytocola sp.]HEV2777903.1 ATP-binding protein [Actinophytocola sp.]
MTPDELRELFLFADLTDEQLAWVAETGRVEEFPAGTMVTTEGEPATGFYVLLSGTLSMSRLVRGQSVEITRSDYRGAYTGSVQFYLGEENPRYGGSTRAVTDCTFLVLPADEFGKQFRKWFPMAAHLLAGVVLGGRNRASVIGQRERLLALGRLTAGLTHELNNPAAAASRATEALRERVAGMRHKLAVLAGSDLDAVQLKRLTAIQEEIVARMTTLEPLSPLDASDREDELGDWLDSHDVPNGWDLAPIFVGGGVTIADLERLESEVDIEHLVGAIHWLGYTVETETLINEVCDATSRISKLLDSAKQYSQLDRTPHQWIDVHDGLNSTLVMFNHRFADGIRVVKDYDRSLPQIPAYPAELNQVWTNLIDNALDAMGAAGTLTIRTALDDQSVLVEICDTGPGVPDKIRDQIFEPFFTTKDVGEGTGLGLDVSWRIVVNRHRGDLRVVSRPGDTRFQVRLPLTEPPEDLTA